MVFESTGITLPLPDLLGRRREGRFEPTELAKRVAHMIARNERWLIDRLTHYARLQGYLRETASLDGVWRRSVARLSAALCTALRRGEATAHAERPDDALALLGRQEARRHRQRGLSVALYLGVLKQQRRAYLDLLARGGLERDELAQATRLIEDYFDRLELVSMTEWNQVVQGTAMVDELRAANRTMSAERSLYLDILESLPAPVLLLDDKHEILRANRAATDLLGDLPTLDEPERRPAYTLPWLAECLRAVRAAATGAALERELDTLQGRRWFQVRLSLLHDVAGRPAGALVVLDDITERRRAEAAHQALVSELEVALANIKTLNGLLPICAHCKKIRDDHGYWQTLEAYIVAHSEAEFTHGICPECMKELYPAYAEAVYADEAPGA